MSSEVQISFIIPTYNEEADIKDVLDSIHWFAQNWRFEIILADNGSTDRTTSIAEKAGAIVLQNADQTIAGLRNLGAGAAKGPVLVFLDGDVLLTGDWQENFPKIWEELVGQEKKLVTGSRCGLDFSPCWIERYWFGPMVSEGGNQNYINSGHLIISRKLFFDLDGFDGNLATGEDFEFCRRARKNGAVVRNNPKLHVVHRGYPKNIFSFMKREMWHGKQDVMSIYDIKESKVAVTSLVFAFFLIVLPGFAILFAPSFIIVVFSLVISQIIALLSGIRRSVRFSSNPLASYFLYNFYFLARAFSLFYCFQTLLNRKTSESARKPQK